MNSIRKWIFKPKKSDTSLLAKFYYADEDLNAVAAELDSFDGRKEPERCTSLINKLRSCQDKLLCIVEKIMQEAIPNQRANRDFRVKFPDDVMQENLAGQLWFGAECLAAGSSIMNREVESASMRPLARTLTHHLDHLRGLLRDHTLKVAEYTPQIKASLALYDQLFAEFELSYVSAMVPVKTMREYDVLQQVMVLFSETVQRAMHKKLITVDMIDSYDPALMFTIPRLAIVCGLHVYPEGPLNPDMDPTNMSEMFRPFQLLLYKIRELLSTLSDEELKRLEKALCSSEQPPSPAPITALGIESPLKGAVTTSSPVQVSVQDSDSDTEYSSACALSSSSASDSSHSLQSEASEVTSSDKHVTSSTGARPKSEEPPGLGRKMPHQISTDSGMPSECDVSNVTQEQVGYFMQADVASSRLRHSKSWPNAKRRTSFTKVSSGCDLGEMGAAGGGASMDLIDSPDIQNGNEEEYNTNILNSRACSSHEFTFSIRADTSILTTASNPDDVTSAHADVTSAHDDVTSAHDDVTSDQMTSSDTSEKSSSAQSSPSHASQVAFVTEALNNVFVTDPAEAEEVTCNCCHDNTDNDDATTRPRDTDKCDTKPGLIEHAQSSKSEHPNNTFTTCDNCRCSAIPTTSHNSDNSTSKDNATVKSSCEKCHKCSKCSSNPRSSAIIKNSHTGNKDDDPNTANSSKVQSQVASNSGDQNTRPSTTTEVSAPAGRRFFRSHSCPCKPIERVSRPSRLSPRAGAVPEEAGENSNSVSQSSKSTYDSDSSSSASEGGPEEENDEITLAIKAAEVAARQEARSRFKSSSELIHRLFVCISGVADQLQTNYAADLRHILKCVFECNASEPVPEEETCSDKGSIDAFVNISAPGSPNDSFHGNDENVTVTPSSERGENNNRTAESTTSGNSESTDPPSWVPDEEAADCFSCKVPFTFVRRRHHCRNCGKVFCGRCSSNAVPLPQFGHSKPVRVCNRCFMFQVTPFTVG